MLHTLLEVETIEHKELHGTGIIVSTKRSEETRHLFRYADEDEDMIKRIDTSDKIWIHHYHQSQSELQ